MGKGWSVPRTRRGPPPDTKQSPGGGAHGPRNRLGTGRECHTGPVPQEDLTGHLVVSTLRTVDALQGVKVAVLREGPDGLPSQVEDVVVDGVDGCTGEKTGIRGVVGLGVVGSGYEGPLPVTPV